MNKVDPRPRINYREAIKNEILQLPPSPEKDRKRRNALGANSYLLTRDQPERYESQATIKITG